VDSRSIRLIGDDQQDIARLLATFRLLAWRAWAEQSRDREAAFAKLAFNALFGLIVGGIYYDVGNSQASIQNRQGVLFFMLINQNFSSVIAVLGAFPKERDVVARERACRAYPMFSYFIAKVVVEMPLNLLPVLVYIVIAYPMIGLQPHRFGWFLLIAMLCNIASINLGLAASAVSKNAEAATAIGVPLLIIGVLFGGFYASIASMPVVVNLIPYLTIFRWAYQVVPPREVHKIHISSFYHDTLDPNLVFSPRIHIRSLFF